MHKVHGISSDLTKEEKKKELYLIFLCRHFEVVIVTIKKSLHNSLAFTYQFCCQIFISYKCLKDYFPK